MLNQGDMIQTAISVARNCGMIPVKDRVIIIEASPPDAHHPASIKWVTAETPDEGTDHYTDSDYTEVRVGFVSYYLPVHMYHY